MKNAISRHWGPAAIAAAIVAVTLIYRWFGPSIDLLQAALLAAVPIAIGARIYGARVAAVVLLVELLVNADLIVAAEGDRVTPLGIVEGLVLCLLGLAGGAALAEKQRVASALVTDPLTGLLNREGLLAAMKEHMKRGDPRMTLVLVQVPELTEIHNTFGYGVSAEIASVIASRVAKVAGSSGLAVKGVRDMFGVLWRDQPLEDAEIARALIDRASGTFEVRGISLKLQAHAAVGRWSVIGGTDPDEIIRAAQRALDRAKATGRDWLPAEPLADGRSRLELVSELRGAIGAGQLRLHYQPIIQLPSRKLRGFEALVRWQHPTRGLVPPAEFIPLAEQSGLIVEVTEWVIEEVMRQIHRWDALGLRPQIAVNVGAKALAASARLPEVVDRLLGAYGVDPTRLVMEVTESDVMQDPARAIGALNALKSLGVRIEVDDFGTGYSSLAYLRQLPLDGVKIDRSFVRTLVQDTNTSAIVRAAIDLAHALGLEAVAEGVEDEEALARLIGSGCDSAQGFLFARPMPAETVPAWLAVTGGSIVASDTEVMPAQALLNGPTVLLVDDEPRMRLSTHRMLSSGGFQVISAATASEALQIYAAQSGDISVVLTDMHLSDWHGHELAARMREARPDLRVLFMSGDAGELRNAGSDSFIVKPFSKRELLEGIKEAMAA